MEQFYYYTLTYRAHKAALYSKIIRFFNFYEDRIFFCQIRFLIKFYSPVYITWSSIKLLQISDKSIKNRRSQAHLISDGFIIRPLS